MLSRIQLTLHVLCDSLTTKRLASSLVQATNVSLVGENPTRSIPALQGYEGLWFIRLRPRMSAPPSPPPPPTTAMHGMSTRPADLCRNDSLPFRAITITGVILKRTYGVHKHLYIPLFFTNDRSSYLLWSPVISTYRPVMVLVTTPPSFPTYLPSSIAHAYPCIMLTILTLLASCETVYVTNADANGEYRETGSTDDGRWVVQLHCQDIWLVHPWQSLFAMLLQ